MEKSSCWQKCLDKGLAILFPFTPLTAQKNENFKTMIKRLENIILPKCTKNHDMARVKCNYYFWFWAMFSPFTPSPTLTGRKTKISKQWKKYLEISSFHTIIPIIKIICYTVPEITARKVKISKNEKREKKHLEI